MTVVGSLQNKSNTRNLIPKKFERAMNYRCTFPIDIRKNIIYGDSPIITNTKHKISTSFGQFTFVPKPISPIKNSSMGLTYDKISGKPNKSYAVGYRRGYKGGKG